MSVVEPDPVQAEQKGIDLPTEDQQRREELRQQGQPFESGTEPPTEEELEEMEGKPAKVEPVKEPTSAGSTGAQVPVELTPKQAEKTNEEES